MKLAKSLLLGSAAGLVAVAGASAADLGVKKPTAVEYVKTCPTYGAGFFVVPGTTSCLKLIGRVRADYIFNQKFARTGDKSVFRARGYVGFDHRTATEYGLVRTYVRAYFQRDNATGSGAVTAQTQLEYAFIQFGGLTVGRVTPVFDHGLNGYMLTNAADTTGTIGGMSDIVYVNSIGYTANFGGGFSATLALDSSAERRLPVVAGLATASGQAMPDVVAALAYDAAWGSVKLAGALHQTRGSVPAAAPFGKEFNKLGYAVQLSAKVNLPFLAKGSNVWASGVIAEGASSYAGYGVGATAANIGEVTTVGFSDAVFALGGLRLTKTWGVAGGIQAFVTPTVYVGLTGTYASMDPFGVANSIKTSSVAGTVGWTPTAGFLIGGEVAYRNMQANSVTYGIAAGTSKHDIVSRIRFQRDF